MKNKIIDGREYIFEEISGKGKCLVPKPKKYALANGFIGIKGDDNRVMKVSYLTLPDGKVVYFLGITECNTFKFNVGSAREAKGFLSVKELEDCFRKELETYNPELYK